MSITLEISCKKCDQKFDYIEIGFGATHPVCLCSGCKRKFIQRKKFYTMVGSAGGAISVLTKRMQ